MGEKAGARKCFGNWKSFHFPVNIMENHVKIVCGCSRSLGDGQDFL